MKIGLLYNKVESLHLTKNEGTNNSEDNVFEIDFKVFYPQSEVDKFHIIFDLHIVHPNDFDLRAKYMSVFSTSSPIDGEFKKSPFTLINAPAIAFPFVRSFVATITLNSGFNPAILPSINFLEFKNMRNKKIHE